VNLKNNKNLIKHEKNYIFPSLKGCCKKVLLLIARPLRGGGGKAGPLRKKYLFYFVAI